MSTPLDGLFNIITRFDFNRLFLKQKLHKALPLSRFLFSIDALNFDPNPHQYRQEKIRELSCA